MANDIVATPMMKQYWAFREKLPANTLLFFRCGDFYEMFGEDAERGAEILGITLTKRGGAALAGVPYHALNNYLAKALKAGVKIAICEQTETPQSGKLVPRAIVRIVTAGTNFDETQLDAKSNNYILALDENKRGLHAAWIDATTGDFYIATSRDPQKLAATLQAIRPSEILIPESWQQGKAPDYLEPIVEWNLTTRMPGWKFDADAGRRAVQRALNVTGLDGFGIAENHAALGPAGALLAYLTETLCESPSFLRKISELRSDETLLIDAASTRNLELFKSVGGTREGSLLAAIDYTHTAAGGRLLEQWLAAPPRQISVVRERQDGVAAFFDHPSGAERVRTALAYVKDVARILGRLQNHMRSPRELGAIRETLRRIPEIKTELALLGSPVINGLAEKISEHLPLRELLESALEEEVPATIEGAIRPGYNSRLDKLRGIRTNSKTWLSEYEAGLQEATQIKNLRVRYNNAFGYYIEVSKSNTSRVPEDFIRRQTLVNAERYTTAELRKKESEILHADELVSKHEADLYAELVSATLAQSAPLLESAAALSQIDVLAGWAQLAQIWDYSRPLVDDSDVLEISFGRHPVVEQMLHRPGISQHFVPNDTSLQASKAQINLITGPNMAGKSTYIRQVALIALLAQIGCWVPAKSAHIGLADRIFCRVGASDELARGNSTFMVEMNETANILNNATEKSIVILDEIGRGTSTYDGLSIAWAVAEYLHGNREAGPRTLFATHYHELTRIADTLPRLKNFCVAVKEWNDEIIFVRQVVPGAADRSYGIHVARLAGLPESVVSRANEILSDLEGSSISFKNPHPPKDFPANDAVAETAPESSKKTAKPRGKTKIRDAASGTLPPPKPAEERQLSLF